MDIRPIRTDKDHKAALKELQKLWGAAPGTPDEDKLEVLATLVEAYEAKHHPIDPPDPIDAVLFRLEQMDLTRADLAPVLGGRNRVSEVLSRTRPLSLSMITRLRAELGIPADVLIPPIARSGRKISGGVKRRETPTRAAALAGAKSQSKSRANVRRA